MSRKKKKKLIMPQRDAEGRLIMDAIVPYPKNLKPPPFEETLIAMGYNSWFIAIFGHHAAKLARECPPGPNIWRGGCANAEKVIVPGKTGTEIIPYPRLLEPNTKYTLSNKYHV